MAKGKAAEGAMDLVGEEVSVYVTDGSRVTKDTIYYGLLQELGEHGIRLKYNAHGSTLHSFIPYSNVIEVVYKERGEKEAPAKGKGKAEDAEE